MGRMKFNSKHAMVRFTSTQVAFIFPLMPSFLFVLSLYSSLPSLLLTPFLLLFSCFFFFFFFFSYPTPCSSSSPSLLHSSFQESDVYVEDKKTKEWKLLKKIGPKQVTETIIFEKDLKKPVAEQRWKIVGPIEAKDTNPRWQ
jgi:hypothetical protein